MRFPRTSRMLRLISIASISVVLLARTGWAQDVDKAAADAVISQQMDAFRHDDAERAYAFASPGIKTLFPDAAGFLAMVRRSYAPVYRPRNVAFGEFKATADGYAQTVAIVDDQGQAWTAFYTLTRSADGTWRITGCILVKAIETSA